MTIYYVDSVAGSNTSPYDTWAKAATAIDNVLNISLGGDTIYVASTHSESHVAYWSPNFMGTVSNPTKIICADKTSGAPPSTIATGATITITGSNQAYLAGVNYFYGIKWVVGTGSASSAILSMNAYTDSQVMEQCIFDQQGTGASGSECEFSCGSKLINCSIKFGGDYQQITFDSKIDVDGLTMLSGSTPTQHLFTNGDPVFHGILRNVDLSAAANTVNLFYINARGSDVTLVNAKMPASWSGSLQTNSPMPAGNRIRLVNSDYSNTNYRYTLQTVFGFVYHETTIYRSGGATDGVTPVSRKLVSNSSAGSFPFSSLITDDMPIWNNTVGSSITATVEFIHDNATALKDDEIWIEVDYMGDSGTPLGSRITDAKANVLATGANQTSSSVTWVGTGGMTNPNKQKCNVTFTPQRRGFVSARIYLCKASYTVYVDPFITIS